MRLLDLPLRTELRFTSLCETFVQRLGRLENHRKKYRVPRYALMTGFFHGFDAAGNVLVWVKSGLTFTDCCKAQSDLCVFNRHGYLWQTFVDVEAT